MNKPNYLYGIIGLLAGLLIGYIGTDSINRNNGPAATANNSATAARSLPPDHPPTGATGTSGASSGAPSSGAEGGPQGDVMAILQQAKNEPTNVDIQMRAADLFLQINRPDGALEFYERVLKVNPRHEKALQNLTQALIDKGDKSAAADSLRRLEQVNPKNQALSQLRSQLQ